jgi:hypothetical protein
VRREDRPGPVRLPTSTARAKTTSCPSGRLCLHPGAAGQEALCDGRLGPHRRRHQPAGQEQAQPLDARGRQASRHAGRLARRRHRAPGSWWTDWSGWLKQPRRQAGGRAQAYGKGASSRPSSRRPAATSSKRPDRIHPQGAARALQRGITWKTSSSFPPPAPRGQVWRLAGQDAATELGAIVIKEALAARQGGTRSAKSSWARCWRPAGQNPARQA